MTKWVFGTTACEASDALAAFCSAGYVVSPEQIPEIDAKMRIAELTTLPFPKTTYSACPYCGTPDIYPVRCPNCGAPRQSIGEIYESSRARSRRGSGDYGDDG